ncbi:MAG: hypothetical protein QOI88_589 [Gammaproteobacteria bacterium]|jgi:cytochrome c556|nr:hypothetical protein [Gammaproteobacteria bacterium]
MNHARCPLLLGGATFLLCACVFPDAPPAAHSPLPQRPIASIQELMQAEVDTSADGVWNAVETISTSAGNEEHQPRTPEEWAAARNAAITLVEATNLLVIDGRRVGAKEFPAEAEGALDSAHIQELIDARRPAFNAFAAALRDAGLRAIAAIDAKDPAALVKAGGAIDEVCESCHLTFWYPGQVIPAFPHADDPRRPIFRAGTSAK